jgi:tetratricopeptide (TPR) repeat protein
MDSESGQGAAIMANSELGILLGDCLLENIAEEYGWKNFVPSDRPRAGAGAVLLGAYQEKGLQSAIQKYWAIKETGIPQFLPDQNTLLMFSYYLAGTGQPDAALEVMNLEVQEFPTFWNAYDSLAELYEMVGEKKLAIQNYEKSVQINPDNWHAAEKLKKLKELN